MSELKPQENKILTPAELLELLSEEHSSFDEAEDVAIGIAMEFAMKPENVENPVCIELHKMLDSELDTPEDVRNKIFDDLVDLALNSKGVSAMDKQYLEVYKVWQTRKVETFQQKKERLTVNVGDVQIEGKDYKFRIVEQKMEPGLPNFIGFNGEEFFISDSVPEKFRKYMFLHEAVCIPKMGTVDHCKNAVVHELETVSPEDMQEYLVFRTKFFQGLVDFYEKRATDKNVAFRNELKKSLDYLKSLS